jgi:hypothetical protein
MQVTLPQQPALLLVAKRVDAISCSMHHKFNPLRELLVMSERLLVNRIEFYLHFSSPNRFLAMMEVDCFESFHWRACATPWHKRRASRVLF